MAGFFIKKNNYLYFLVLIALSIFILRSIPAWFSSAHFIDEECIVYSSVGFLGLDLNPGWFGYHTLPLYLLASIYFSLFSLSHVLGQTASILDFVSLVYSNPAVFFISAKIFFNFAYVLACFILAVFIYKKNNNKFYPILFLFLVNISSDSLWAAIYPRVDTFVFLFLTLTIYFSIFAPKKSISFFLSIVFCCAAFDSKFPAIVFFPVLFIFLIRDILAGAYPKKYIYYFIVLVPFFIFVFMPFIVLDHHAYRSMLDDIFSRVSGDFIQVGKLQLGSFAERTRLVWKYFYQELGLFVLTTSVVGFLYLAVRMRHFLASSIFCLFYLITFSTSNNIDSYWLRPIYPFFYVVVFLALGEFSKNTLPCKKISIISARQQRGIFCIVFTICLLIAQQNNIKHFASMLSNRQIDTRITSKKWIEANLPEYSLLWMDGVKQYLPKIFSPDKRTNRYMTAVISEDYGRGENAILHSAYEKYFSENYNNQPKMNVDLLGNGSLTSFDRRIIALTKGMVRKGAYIIISSSTYQRYYWKHTEKEFPDLTLLAQEYYSLIRSQRHVKTFKGKGPTIEIYQKI